MNSKNSVIAVFSKLRISEDENFLAIPYSPKHGDGSFLTDDPIQLAGWLLKETLGERGMIIILRSQNMTIVENFGEYPNLGVIEFKKRDLERAGEIYRDRNYYFIGVLVDKGSDEDGIHTIEVISNERVNID